jgi:hypothetical protein
MPIKDFEELQDKLKNPKAEFTNEQMNGILTALRSACGVNLNL